VLPIAAVLASFRADGPREVVLLGTLANDEYDPAIEAGQFDVLSAGLCGSGGS
jgi:hypothetical protein